jgi:hypothetical protein
MRGKFVGDAPDLADPSQEYPTFRWKTKIKSLKRTEAGGYELTPDEELTAQFNSEVTFQPTSFEVWGLEGAKPASASPGVAEIKRGSAAEAADDEGT